MVKVMPLVMLLVLLLVLPRYCPCCCFCWCLWRCAVDGGVESSRGKGRGARYSTVLHSTVLQCTVHIHQAVMHHSSFLLPLNCAALRCPSGDARLSASSLEVPTWRCLFFFRFGLFGCADVWVTSLGKHIKFFQTQFLEKLSDTCKVRHLCKENKVEAPVSEPSHLGDKLTHSAQCSNLAVFSRYTALT